MSETCPVCEHTVDDGATKCDNCKFEDALGIDRVWPNPEDGDRWLDTVVKPYRKMWKDKREETAKQQEALKQNEELRAQLAATQAKLDAAVQREAAAVQKAAKLETEVVVVSSREAELVAKVKATKDLLGVVAVIICGAAVIITTISWFHKPATTPAKGNTDGSSATAASQAAPSSTPTPQAAAPQPTGASFTDSRDGQTYRIVKIGNQTWMAENLNYKVGTSWCYSKDESNCSKYGKLYDWNAAKSACPKGWHLPSREEWDQLVEAAGGERVAGQKLKSKRGWHNNGNGTDEFGFSALPGGYRHSYGHFDTAGDLGYWWSAAEYGSGYAYYRFMGYHYDGVNEGTYGKSGGFSVRCVEDRSGER